MITVTKDDSEKGEMTDHGEGNYIRRASARYRQKIMIKLS